MFFALDSMNTTIVFQKFDEDWECYVDLNDDYVAEHKDRLKIVLITCNDFVSPSDDESDTHQADDSHNKQHDSDASSELFEEETHSFNDDDSYYVAPKRRKVASPLSDPLIDDDELQVEEFVPQDKEFAYGLNTTITPKRQNLDHVRKRSNDNATFISNTPKRILKQTDEKDVKLLTTPPSVKKIQKKTEEQLPDPFPLPKHYSSEVEIALSNKKMTKETTRSFLSSVASAMLSFKRYPSREEYTRVAKDIILKHPFLKPSNGSPTGGIIQSLIDRFKQFRRTKTDRSSPQSSVTQKKISLRAPCTSIDHASLHLPGEDKASCESHNKTIKAKLKKSKGGNAVVVQELVKRTYSFRREDILSCSRDVSSALEKYPFLKIREHIFMEMERICDKARLQAVVRETWEGIWSPKIFQLAAREAPQNRNLSQQMQRIPSSFEKSGIASLCFLVYLLPERNKPDHEKIVYFAPDSCDPQSVVNDKKQLEPFVLIMDSTGSTVSVSQAFLVIAYDGQILCEINNKLDIPFAILSAFYVFNICYTKGCGNFYCFLEAQLLGITHKKTPSSVSHFISRLEQTEI